MSAGCANEGGAGGRTEEPTTGCVLVGNHGCPDGEICAYDDEASDTVCALAGSALEGESCDADIGCAEGTCLSINGTDFRCYIFCRDGDDCEVSGTCLELDGAAYKVCEQVGMYDHCDLLQQDCSGDAETNVGKGKGCYLLTGVSEPVCLAGGSAGAGEACEAQSACVAGAACVNRRCRSYCDTNSIQPCADSFTPCMSFYGRVGVCEE